MRWTRQHLLWVIKELAGTRYDRFSSDGGPKVTPDEKRLYATYGGEWTRLYNSPLSPKDKERLMNLHGSYIVGSDLRDELLRRFFSSDFRASYYRATGEQPPPQSDSRVPASTATGSTDGTDIVKAKAAKVDITVFGMQLGDPFRLSQCPLVGIDFIKDNCRIGQNLFSPPNTNADPEVVQIRLAPDFRPEWVAEPDLSTGSDGAVRVHDGLLVGVYVLTKGRNAEKLINAELRAKYGLGSGAHVGTITPDTGNAFNVSNPEWIFPGMHVEYEVVQVIPNEDRVNLNNGVVRVETAAAYKRRMDKRNAPVKRKM
jgi:hypothetical protein